MTEYWLQKKAFNSWSHVTWYDNEAEAIKNFNRVAVEGNGYSWRMVRVEVVEERLLSGERPVMKQDEDEAVEPVKPGWGGFNIPSPNSSHGMIGKVWLANPTTKEKKRVDPALVDAMMKEGWIKAGPRTVL